MSLALFKLLNRQLLWLRVRLILLFVTILQKYISTLRIVWARRCCIYHESKMGMTPQRLLFTLKGSGSGSLRSTRSFAVLCLLLCEYYIQCSLYMHYMILRRFTPYEKQMKGSKHLYIPACTAILVFTGFHAQPRCSQSLDVTSPTSFMLV